MRSVAPDRGAQSHMEGAVRPDPTTKAVAEPFVNPDPGLP